MAILNIMIDVVNISSITINVALMQNIFECNSFSAHSYILHYFEYSMLFKMIKLRHT